MYVRLRGALGRWVVAGTDGDKARVQQWHPWDEWTPEKELSVPRTRLVLRWPQRH